MNQHKDLPPASQSWAKEVDALMGEVKHLREVVRRLTENAGIDYSNPKRGLNTGGVPSTNNPVGQKMSSLADVQTYNVADGQYLSWSQKGQKWLPATLSTTSGGEVPIPMAYTNGGDMVGHGRLDQTGGKWAYHGYNTSGTAETWGTKTAYMGAGNWDLGPVALVTASYDGFNRPFVSLSSEDFADGTNSYFNLFSYGLRLNTPRVRGSICTTVNRPTGLTTSSDDVGSQVYDLTLKKPIWWNGTAWTDALGTAV